MKQIVFLICFSVCSLFSLSAFGSDTGDYETYRTAVDTKIRELGYTELRNTLSEIIHSLDEPWEIEYYKKCVEREKELDKKYSNRTNKENCEQHLTENLDYREKRLEVIVDAIILELNNAQDKFGRKWFWSKEDLALVALNKMHNESGRFKVKVHKGWKRGDRGRSYCLGQVWSRKGDKYYGWNLVGYDDDKFFWSLRRTRNCSYMVFQHLTYHSYRCVLKEKVPVENGKDDSKYPLTMYRIAMVYSGYATGRYCKPGFPGVTVKKGKIVKLSNGRNKLTPHWEPLRRAKKFWSLKVKFLNQD